MVSGPFSQGIAVGDGLDYGTTRRLSLALRFPVGGGRRATWFAALDHH